MRTIGRRAYIVAAAISVVGLTCVPTETLPASAQGPDAVIPLLREGIVGSIPSATVVKDNFASSIDFISCDTLTSYASDGRLVPDLAASITQPNDVTYIYHIRHGVKVLGWQHSDSCRRLLGTSNLAQGQFNVADYAPPGLDELIKAGISTDNDPDRFGIYATILKRLSVDVPYVGLFDGDSVVALSKAFSWSSYGPYSTEGFWPLGVKSTAR